MQMTEIIKTIRVMDDADLRELSAIVGEEFKSRNRMAACALKPGDYVQFKTTKKKYGFVVMKGTITAINRTRVELKVDHPAQHSGMTWRVSPALLSRAERSVDAA